MRHREQEHGFTLLEVLVTCVILGALLLIGAMPFLNWQRQREQRDTVRQVVAELRNAQTRAMAEGTAYRVDVSSDGVDTFKVVGGVATRRSGWDIPGSRVELSGAQFRDPLTAAVDSSVWFLPRGVASDGSVDITRPGSSTTYTIDVEGLTSRVSYTG